MEFKVGDIVQLKSGGPLMTVDYIVGAGSPEEDSLLIGEGLSNGDIICQWFNEGNVMGRSFKPEVLKKIKKT